MSAPFKNAAYRPTRVTSQGHHRSTREAPLAMHEMVMTSCALSPTLSILTVP